MSSVHRQKGNACWFCALYDPEGYRRFRSTGATEKRVAKSICDAWDQTSRLARAGKLSNDRALKVIRDTVKGIEEIHGPLVARQADARLRPTIEEFVKLAGGSLESYTVESWLNAWHESRTDASVATRLEYRRSADIFVEFLGPKAKRPLSSISPQVIEEFKAWMAKAKAPATCNKVLKIIRSAFNRALAARQIDFNPSAFVSGLTTAGEPNRVPFELEEVTKLVKKAEGDQLTLVLVGFYAGLRLRDAANLIWKDVDLVKKVISIGTDKTGQRVIVPIAAPLQRHLEALPRPSNPVQVIMPSYAGKRSGWLSNQFHALMVKVGLAEKRTHKTTGKGRVAKRNTTKQSFHSLRYSFISALKNSGASESVAMDLAGHVSKEISKHYTKIDESVKAEVIAKLPDLTQ